MTITLTNKLVVLIIKVYFSVLCSIFPVAVGHPDPALLTSALTLQHHHSDSDPVNSSGLKVNSSTILTVLEYAEDISCETEKTLLGKSIIS
jgi:hypothetical protein